jgi:hypothetical protein
MKEYEWGLIALGFFIALLLCVIGVGIFVGNSSVVGVKELGIYFCGEAGLEYDHTTASYLNDTISKYKIVCKERYYEEPVFDGLVVSKVGVGGR